MSYNTWNDIGKKQSQYYNSEKITEVQINLQEIVILNISMHIIFYVIKKE